MPAKPQAMTTDWRSEPPDAEGWWLWRNPKTITPPCKYYVLEKFYVRITDGVPVWWCYEAKCYYPLSPWMLHDGQWRKVPE